MASENSLALLVNVGDNGEASVLRSYLEHHGIHVYVKGENHRSLLGMVGTYIELNIMVPQSQLEEAQELYKAYVQGQNEIEVPEESEADSEEGEDDEQRHWLQEAEFKRAKTRSLFAAFILPFGGAHYSIGAYASGLLLTGISIYSIIQGTSNPMYFGVWGLAFCMDLLGSRHILRSRAKAALPRTYVHSYKPEDA